MPREARVHCRGIERHPREGLPGLKGGTALDPPPLSDWRTSNDLFLNDFSIDPKTNSNQQQIQKRSETKGGARAAEQIGKQVSKSSENVSQIH